MNTPRKLAILLFPDAEVLDFCGPFEVFTVANRSQDQPAFEVFTVAENSGPVIARNGLSVNPHYSLGDCPQPDILLIPGGIGTRQEIENECIIEWIKRTAASSEIVLSVCTGALLLGKAGLLNDREVTTHHAGFELLREIVSTAVVHENKRYVDTGKIITSAGIAAGIDMSLHVVRRLLGAESANATATYMEYPWQP